MQIHEERIYWPCGKLKRLVQFQDGKRSGVDQIFSLDGSLVDEGFFLEGKPIQTHRRFDRKGTLIEKIVYHTPEKFTYNAFDSSGDLKLEGFWTETDEYVERRFDASTSIWTQTNALSQKNLERCLLNDFSDHRFKPLIVENEAFLENLEIFLQKHPQYRFQIPKTLEAYSDVELLEKFSFGKAKVIFIWGLGGGGAYFQLQDFLQASLDHKIVFIETDLNAIAMFLHTSYAKEILQHKNVWIEPSEEVFLICQKYLSEHFECVKIPSKERGEFESFKESFLKAMTLKNALFQEVMHGEQILGNFLQNLEQLPTSFYVNLWKGAFASVPVIICGAGPSLNQNFEALKKLYPSALIIAAGSAITALSSQNVSFHLAVAIDPNLEEYRRLRHSLAMQMIFLYSLRVHPDVFRTFTGHLGYMRAGIGGVLEVWLEEQLELNETFIGQKLSSETISVTGICVALAEYLGATEIYLAGVDLAYVENQHYAKGVSENCGIDIDSLDAEKCASSRIFMEKNSSGKSICTATRWLMERNSISHFARMHPHIEIFNLSSQGLDIPDVNRISIDLVLEKHRALRNIDAFLNDKIQLSSFPLEIKEKIEKAKNDLKTSFLNVLDCYKILSGSQKGSKALAEISLQEELVYDLLFHDMERMFESCVFLDISKKWMSCEKLAQKYIEIFAQVEG